MCGGVQDILKIASYALCFDSSESGKFEYPKHCDTKMPMVCICAYARSRVPLDILYVRRGLRCCCFDTKAIPEPR